MELYCGIDLHSNNSVVVIQSDPAHQVLHQRFPNELELICFALSPYRGRRGGIDV